MTKYLITADFHILEKRISEIKSRVFVPMISKLIEDKDIEGICILGDIFDYDQPNDKEIDLFIDFIHAIPLDKIIYILSGNHDIDKTNNAISWVDKLRGGIRYSKEALGVVIDGKRIKMIHSDVAESKVGPNDRVFNKKQSFKEIEGEILLLGHIHSAQVISEDPLCLHPGSPYYINFGERNDAKGYFIVNFTDSTYEFIKLNPIPMIQIDVTDDDIATLQETVNKIDGVTKLKLNFKLQSASLEASNQIQSVIKYCTKMFYEFKWDIEVTPTQHTVPDIKAQMQDKTIPSLLDKFCEVEKVDKEIQDLLKSLL